MHEVIPGFFKRQGQEMKSGRNSLRQLPQVRAIKHLVQFRLAHQNDLKQFSLIGFKISEKADLL